MGERALDGGRVSGAGGDADRPRLRIVFVLPVLSDTPSGGYRVVYSYANHLAARQHAVTIVHALHLRGGSTRKRSARARVLRAWAEAKKLRSRLDYHVSGREARPSWFHLDDRVTVLNTAYLTARGVPPADVVVATAVHTAPVAASACRRQGATGAYLIQSYEDWMADSDYVDATWRLPLRKVVIADWLAERGHDLGVETVLVPNGIDGGEFPPGPAVADRTYDIVAMASEIPVKRMDVLIRAVEEVRQRRGWVRVAAFGTGAQPQGMPTYVDYTRSPSREVLAELYRSAKVYLCTSDAEGWHLPPAEAMSSGAAVVTTDIGGVLAYARGVSSTAPAGDAVGLADRVVELLDDPDRCQELATAGQERIRSYGSRAAAGAFENEVVAAWRRDHEGRSNSR